MSVRRGFNPLAAFAPRRRTRDHRPILPFALLLMGAALVPAPGRTQESSPPPAESTGAPKPDTNQSAPAPAEPSAPAAPSTSPAPAPGSVQVPEVIVTPPKPKRVAHAPRPPAGRRRRPTSDTAAVAIGASGCARRESGRIRPSTRRTGEAAGPDHHHGQRRAHQGRAGVHRRGAAAGKPRCLLQTG
jgi:hypothetical protein